MTIEFIVPGKPVPMARPRINTETRTAYTPRRSVEYRKAVSLYAKTAMKGREPLAGAVLCRIEIGLAIPKSYTGKKKLAAVNNIISPINKQSGDVDNYAKAIMDALKDICWVDDAQVKILEVSKCFAIDGSWAKVKIMDLADCGGVRE